METKNNSQQTQLTETSVLLSIPSLIAASTLSKIEEREIKCEYHGVDESGHIIMKLSYLEWQEKFLKEIISEMKEGNAVINLLFTIATEVLIENYKQYKSK